MSKHIAFIGVGNMGNPMAQQLVNAGKQVKVFDVSTKKTMADYRGQQIKINIQTNYL